MRAELLLQGTAAWAAISWHKKEEGLETATAVVWVRVKCVGFAVG